MQVPPSLTNDARKIANDENNEDTLNTYIKEAARLMKPSKDVENKKDKEDERKDGAEKLLQEILTIDLKNPIHAAKSLRAAEKHKAIAGKWRNQHWRNIGERPKRKMLIQRKALKKWRSRSATKQPTPSDM